MYIREIHVQGFRDLPEGRLQGLDRVVHLRGPSPATTALADAVELVFATLSHDGVHRLVQRWELASQDAPPEVIGDDFPEAVDGVDPLTAQALLHPDNNRRTLQATVLLALDPPLHGHIRSLAARHPAVLLALAEDPTLSITATALFTRSLDHVSLALDRVAIGRHQLALHTTDKPTWVPRLLRDLSRRFHRHSAQDNLIEALADAALGRDRFDRYVAWQGTLGDGAPRLRVASGPGGHPMLLADELPLRRLGSPTLERVQLAAAVHLSGADVLWAQSADPVLLQAIEGDSSPLEQVFAVSSEGTIEVMATTESPPSSAPLVWAGRRG